jgi:hypothetical protein
VKEARAVIDRLERIEAMELVGEPALHLLDELELLLAEAGRWLEREERSPGASEARAALERFRLALNGDSNSARRPRAVCPKSPARSIR